MLKRLPGPVKGEFEERKYQLNVFDEVWDRNSLVVLPTALGKTMIAVFLAAEKIEKSDGQWVVAVLRDVSGDQTLCPCA